LQAVAPDGVAVLNAEDPGVVELDGHNGGSVLWFALDPDHPGVRAHCARGGRALVLRDGRPVLAEGAAEVALPDPITPIDGCTPQGVLAALAAAWALGVPAATLAEALRG
jgi:cyanophycin synthetase